MRRAIIAMAFAALAQPAGARADGSPLWASRAKGIVAYIHVPKRGATPAQSGAGFFVGFEGRTAYLVTAGHVIWPLGPPQEDENVNLRVSLPACDSSVLAVASSAQASIPPVGDPVQVSSHDKLDVAVVKIHLTDLPSDVRSRCEEVLSHLPRHIIDPDGDGDSLPENTPAWLIGPGIVFQGRDLRPNFFKKYVGNELQFNEEFTPGDSGSPIFSGKGYVIGMAIEDNGIAARFSTILAKLDKDWEIPTNLTGSCTKLLFGNEYKGALLSVDGAPNVPLRLPHPAPLGSVILKLQISNTQEVTDTVDVRGGEMSCEVTRSRWLARHKRAGTYATLGFIAATGIAFATARTFQNSFDQSPSKSSYDHAGLFKTVTIGTGLTAFASLVVTVAGYASSDKSGITCRDGQ